MRSIPMVVATIALSGSLLAQTPTGNVAYDLTTPAGVVAGTLRMPAGRRVPAVLMLGGAPDVNATIADALSTNGVATVRYTARASADGVSDASLWIAKLRNDVRFKSVTIAGVADGSLTALLAAREGRADGFVSVGGAASPSATRQLAMLKRETLVLPAGAAADTAAAIAAYVNNLSLPQHPTVERRSPRTVTSATIDGVRIAVEYGQLGVRDRAIWGAIVPWDKVWVPGADETTTLTTSAPVVLGGLGVPAGDHTLYAMPSADTFMLIVNKQIYQYHTVYQEAQDLGRVKMSMTKLDQPAELLRFEIVKTATGGVLKFAWADREYAVPFTVDR